MVKQSWKVLLILNLIKLLFNVLTVLGTKFLKFQTLLYTRKNIDPLDVKRIFTRLTTKNFWWCYNLEKSLFRKVIADLMFKVDKIFSTYGW